MLINKQNVLIIDSRKELSMKYKKLIEQNIFASAMILGSDDGVYDYIKNYEPDLIIISDSLQTSTNEICTDLRKYIKDYRPVLVVLSKSSHLDDKIANLNCGADDFISEPIDNEEFIARIGAHLRRTLEEHSSLLTHLPTSASATRVLKRVLSARTSWAAILVGIDYVEQYRQIYGDLAADKMVQTYSAIIRSTIDECDFLGQLDEDNFIIITIPEQADKITRTLTYAFDKVSSRFYTDEDANKGYITLFSDKTAGRRVPLVTTSIGVVENTCRAYENYQDILNVLYESFNLAKSQAGSYVIKDAPQICGIDSVSTYKKNKVLVVENDAALAYLITSTLDMQGNQTQALSNYDKVAQAVEEFAPDVIVLDAGDAKEHRGIEICSQLKDKNLKVIVSTVLHDKELVLNAGADLYLPKPYDIVTLHSWVKRFLEE